MYWIGKPSIKYLNTLFPFYSMSSLSLRLVLVLFVISSLAFSSFNVQNYIYPNETSSSINYTNFSYNGNAYSLVSISSAPTFLLKNGDLVNGSSEISDVLGSYYRRNYYLSDDDISQLKALVKKFNDSRNDGYDAKNKEEYTCRNDVLFADGKIKFNNVPLRCTNVTSCQRVAELLFSIYGDGLGLGSPSVIYTPLYDFAPTSFAIDGLLENISNKLNSLNEDNVGSTLQYIKNSTPTLKTYSLKIESTVFRSPRLNDTADKTACRLKCYAICPSMQLDRSSLDSLQNLSNTLLTKIAPLRDLSFTSTSVSRNTDARLSYFVGETLAVEYTNRFSSVNSSGTAAILLGDRAISVATDSNLSTNLNLLKDLNASITQSIAARNFTNLNYSISQYSALKDKVNTSASALIYKYNSVLDSKSAATTSLLVLNSKDLDPQSLTSVKSLENRTILLDSRFRAGLTAPELDLLKGNYTEVSKQASRLILAEDNAPSSRMISTFRGFVKNFNSGFANMATSTKLTTSRDVQTNTTATFGGLSVIVFLSLSSLAFLVFLYLLISAKANVPKVKQVLTVGFASTIIFLFIFSFFVFLFLDKTTNNATLSEFLADFKDKPSTSVIVDLRSSPITDTQSVVDCGARLSDSLKSMNRTTTFYLLTPSSCNVVSSSGANSTTTVSNCLSSISNQSSSFVLSAAAKTEKPRFSILYQNRAYISANADYYRSCPMASLFG